MKAIRERLRQEYRNLNTALWNASYSNPIPRWVVRDMEARMERIERVLYPCK